MMHGPGVMCDWDSLWEVTNVFPLINSITALTVPCAGVTQPRKGALA